MTQLVVLMDTAPAGARLRPDPAPILRSPVLPLVTEQPTLWDWLDNPDLPTTQPTLWESLDAQ